MEMQHQAMGYDRTATMFSPDGHLLQVEYAEKTVRLGVSSIGMACSDGVFIIADKRINDTLIVSESATRIHEVDNHVIASAAGITSDARVLIEKAQVLAQQHRVTYDSPIEPESVIKELSNMKQQFTQYGGARPFGVSMMLAGINGTTPEIFTSDVTGNYFQFHTNAIGEGDERIRDLLRERYKNDLTIKQGVKLALDIFKEVKDGKFNIEKFELSYIKSENPTIIRAEGKNIEKI